MKLKLYKNFQLEFAWELLEYKNTTQPSPELCSFGSVEWVLIWCESTQI